MPTLGHETTFAGSALPIGPQPLRSLRALMSANPQKRTRERASKGFNPDDPNLQRSLTMQHPETVWAVPYASKIEVDPSIGTRWREPIENEAKAKVEDEFKFGLAKFPRYYVIHLLFLHYLSCDQPGGVHKTTLRGGTQSQCNADVLERQYFAIMWPVFVSALALTLRFLRRRCSAPLILHGR